VTVTQKSGQAPRARVGAVACAPVLSFDGTVVSRMPPMTCNRSRLMFAGLDHVRA
jgi:hypothetical protein